MRAHVAAAVVASLVAIQWLDPVTFLTAMTLTGTLAVRAWRLERS